MKTLLVIASALVVSASVSAKSVNTYNDDKLFVTDTFSTKQEALDAGFGIYDSLKTADHSRLRYDLAVFDDNLISDVSIDSANVKIEEIATSRSETMYRAIVDVDYSYNYRESSSD